MVACHILQSFGGIKLLNFQVIIMFHWKVFFLWQVVMEEEEEKFKGVSIVYL